MKFVITVYVCFSICLTLSSLQTIAIVEWGSSKVSNMMALKLGDYIF
jgi:hypothetical protein